MRGRPREVAVPPPRALLQLAMEASVGYATRSHPSRCVPQAVVTASAGVLREHSPLRARGRKGGYLRVGGEDGGAGPRRRRRLCRPRRCRRPPPAAGALASGPFSPLPPTLRCLTPAQPGAAAVRLPPRSVSTYPAIRVVAAPLGRPLHASSDGDGGEEERTTRDAGSLAAVVAAGTRKGRPGAPLPTSGMAKDRRGSGGGGGEGGLADAEGPGAIFPLARWLAAAFVPTPSTSRPTPSTARPPTYPTDMRRVPCAAVAGARQYP